MSCDVYVYDDLMRSLSSNSIEILETDHWGGKIDLQMSTQFGFGGYGATLVGPNPAEPINIYVDDNNGIYAGTSLGHLKLPARLDVALYPLPTITGAVSGGAAPQTANQIAAFIVNQVESGVWRDAEAVGVRNLVLTVTHALSSPKWASDETYRLQRWCDQLNALGIALRV